MANEKLESVTQGEPERQYCFYCSARIYFDTTGVIDTWRHHGSNFTEAFSPFQHYAKPQPAQPSPVVQKCPTCGSPERNKCFGHCPDKWHDGYEPLGIYGTSVAPVVPVEETKSHTLESVAPQESVTGPHPTIVGGTQDWTKTSDGLPAECQPVLMAFRDAWNNVSGFYGGKKQWWQHNADGGNTKIATTPTFWIYDRPNPTRQQFFKLRDEH